MRSWSFIVGVFGIFVLLLIMFFAGSVEVESAEELGKLEVNQKVFVEGAVLDERKFGDGVKLELDDEILVLCDGCGFGFVSKNVKIYGVVQEVYGEKMVGVLRMVILD